ncbi:30S ribosomal protein S16 [Streptomyces sp. NPDC012461]|uniref:Small ribosomal subunit protein bS16 n=2 Tax=unclassified Streptomyces TaxID=2593676 RepID=A0A6G3R002_9ACTN|nr:30S ribosomal protein S16 [Streptomyces sp. H28]MBM7088719.1 30S ribosomal protein S16 [Streptomyces sp. S12]NEA88770.1 30S ribosomal protein S16 [Streptomyces sp. SID14436]NEC25112.1 30S ribosomal protein S16 [Streptomyces sp. SID8111]NEC80209.1 30S ribosomal protein S16 [Streptomyces sp. SID7958]NED19791.1 30S ribosomal protein S16 [Streptomyces sp. SID9913]
MAVKIKLKRLGKIRSPHYRIVVADARTRRDGRAIEEIGKYHPTYNPSVMEVDSERVAYWLGVGAQPTEAVRAILQKTGDWQKFKGEPAPAPLLQPEEKAARPSFEAIGGDDDAKGEAITQKKKADKKDEAAADSSASEPTEA